MINRASGRSHPLLSEYEPYNRALQVLFSKATFHGLLPETDPQKVASAFVERLTDAVCYTAKWLKSS
jgi:hypothetical protein